MVSGKDAGDGGIVALLRAGDVRTLLTRYSDLALAGLVVAIVGMMIVPLPTPLLDLLISVNIAAAVVLLLVAIYVSDALKIATFPTLLLLTTLFRLALEVSATRLILLRADAGEVIRALRQLRRRRQPGGRRGRLPDPDDDPVHRHLEGLGARRRGGGALHAGRDAGQADVDRRRAARRPHRSQRGAAPAARRSRANRSSSARWTAR